MDTKKFLQLVEEKKKRILEKKEATLKWEQKLEAAVKGKADSEAKRRPRKSLGKRKSASGEDSDNISSDSDQKSSKRSHKKHKKIGHTEIARRERKYKHKSSRTSKHYYISSSDEYDSDSSSDSDSGSAQQQRKKYSHKRKSRHCPPTESSLSEVSDGENFDTRKDCSRHHKHHHRLNADDSMSELDESKTHKKHYKGHHKLDGDDSSSSFEYENRKSPEEPRKTKEHHRHGHHHHRTRSPGYLKTREILNIQMMGSLSS